MPGWQAHAGDSGVPPLIIKNHVKEVGWGLQSSVPCPLQLLGKCDLYWVSKDSHVGLGTGSQDMQDTWPQ